MHNLNPNLPKGHSKCLDTCVSKLAKGDETGVYYVIDFGGTNVRCARCFLKGDRKLILDSISKDARNVKIRNLPKGLMDPKATATELFNFIAEVTKECMVKHKDMVEGKEIEDYDRIFSVGFTFSYGTRQTALNSAYCTNWAKGWETGIQTDDPVTSDKIDLAILLNQAFNRLKIPAKTVAILNDTVGTLVAGSYTKEQYSPDAMIGLIAGTGYNMCYFDPHAHQYNYKGNVINLECGGFDGFLPNNIIDHEVDDATAPHGLQRFEKMVAGLYIPELARRLILRVFRSKAPKLCWCHDSITTKAVFKIMEDETPDLAVVKNAVATLFEWDTNTLSLTELNAIKQICKTVIVRSSTMIAAAIAAVASLTGRLSPASGGLTIAVDGSIYTKNKSYRDLLSAKLVDILGPNLARLIKFHISSDGSGIGAAILAATANKIVLRNC